MDFESLYFLKPFIRAGGVLAMIISWNKNKSILMALVHGFLGWFYVIYYYINRDKNKKTSPPYP